MKTKFDLDYGKLVKFIIYGILLTLPLIAVLNQVLFTTYNRNLVVSASDKNLFFDAMQNVSTNAMFSWVNDTAIYDVINNTINGFTTSNNSIFAFLITYMMLMLAIIFVFDIIIYWFNKLINIVKR